MLDSQDSKVIDSIIENLFHIFPVLLKKLLKVDTQSVHSQIKLTRLHLFVMWMIKKERLSASELARRFQMLRPQMTRLIKELVSAGLVEKQPDINDRRVTYILLTPNGEDILKQCRKLTRNRMKRRLAHLDKQDIEELSLLLTKMRSIASKLEYDGG